MVNGLDYGIIGCIIISGVIGLLRGFVREAISMITWVSAIGLGVMYCERFSIIFNSISTTTIRLLLSFLLIVFSILILGGIINYIFARLVALSGLGTTDRLIGMIFGLVRAGAIVSALILLTEVQSLHHLTEDVLWKESKLIPVFTQTAKWLKSAMPEDLLHKLKL